QRFDLTKYISAGSTAYALTGQEIVWKLRIDKNGPYVHYEFQIKDADRSKNLAIELDRMLSNNEPVEEYSEMDIFDLLVLLSAQGHVFGRRLLQLYTVLFGGNLEELQRAKLEKNFSRAPVLWQMHLPRIVEQESNLLVRQIWDSVLSVSSQRRGGSVTTVFFVDCYYLGKTQKYALHVSNVNNLYFLQEISRLAKRVIQASHLTQTRKDLALYLIDVAEWWVKGEILDPNFFENHEIYRGLYCHTTERGKITNEFLSPRGRVKFYVPRFVETYSVNFRLQEVAEGKTLDEIENIEEFLLESGSSPNLKKEVASALIKWFFHQTSTGIIHSNIHPGNLIFERLDESVKITVLDTKNFVILDNQTINNLKESIALLLINPFEGFKQLLDVLVSKENSVENNLDQVYQDLVAGYVGLSSKNAGIHAYITYTFETLFQHNLRVKPEFVVILQSVLGLYYCLQRIGLNDTEILETFKQSFIESSDHLFEQVSFKH
ncbi:MAG: hypothetical protein NZO16_07050, partial [Deltaproteobacteria bacterium]|nr:hypothetical protein [Deltaproteobacteria bacterium]